MSAAASRPAASTPDIRGLLRDAADAARRLVEDATASVRERISDGAGRIDRTLAEGREQHAVHGLAWWGAYAEVMGCVSDWIDTLASEGRGGEAEVLLAQILVAEYAAQMIGGVPMNQGEIVRPGHLGLSWAHVRARFGERLIASLEHAGSQVARSRLVHILEQGRARPTFEDAGLDDVLDMVREQFHAFGAERIAPHAHGWHLSDELIPLSVVDDLASLGLFGLTIPEVYGGAAMGKVAMCVVSEELSRGYLGVGSLATRSEIAGELILTSGTAEQKRAWLPRIASGEVLPTAVFTEPSAGSDLGSLQTRAVLAGEHYHVSGAKTWITHAARADLMTLLVRTDPHSRDHRGLSMLLAAKTRADETSMFPDAGLTGSEIPAIGYRGMREYELAFDAFHVPRENLLGGGEGQGFKQLMATFESARIQTAARAIGVAQCALDHALAYAAQRRQFGARLADFPRVQNKLAMMAAEIAGVRQLTYAAARRKDDGKRCDLEAGMAKLLAARVAWAAADNALQVHGGNGFAVEYPISRILADARILNIFEGAGEIQAQVIGRRLFDLRN